MRRKNSSKGTLKSSTPSCQNELDVAGSKAVDIVIVVEVYRSRFRISKKHIKLFRCKGEAIARGDAQKVEADQAKEVGDKVGEGKALVL